MVKDYLSKILDSQGAVKPLDYSQLDTIKEEVNMLHTLSLAKPRAKVITMDATSPHRRAGPFLSPKGFHSPSTTETMTETCE